MALLRSIAFYLLFYSGSVIFVLGSVLFIGFDTGKMRAMVRGWARWQRWCLRNIVGIRVRIEGSGPHEAPALYAIKHESFFEAIDAPALFKIPSVFAKQELFSIPGWGKAALAYGLIPVERTAGAKALRNMISRANERVAEGRPLVIFPEGTRTPHGECPPLRAGFAGLYKLVGLPVVPVAVDSGPLYHRWIKRPGTITYKFGEPIPAGLPREEAEARVHASMNALN